jgi:hypothetical protein
MIVQIALWEETGRAQEGRLEDEVEEVEEEEEPVIHVKDYTKEDESDPIVSNVDLSDRFIIESENENLKNTLKIKEETIQIQEEHITSLSDEMNEIKAELEASKKELANELIRKNEDIDFIKKESLELKEKYEREFELVSSSLYNLGLSYWSMKIEFTQKLSEKPTWLMKERQKFYNGDF